MSDAFDSDDENHLPHHHQQPHQQFQQHQFPHPFNQMAGMFGAGLGGAPGFMMGGGGHGMGFASAPAPPSAFNRPYRAYSAAIHEITYGKGNAGASMRDGGREQVMFGGQILLPPSALRHLTELDIESPWTFELINPNKRHLKTHAGVLEFTAEENNVYLPSWMMKRLELSEGDPIRLFGTRLPPGKLVKLQAQSVTFLELSDPKAVLEQALRAYSALTKGDIIEISYNMMTFELLVMEVEPDAAGIYIREVDLEVDFAPPVGYVEPERKPAAPLPTMQSKFSISINSTQSVDAKGSGSSTPVGGAGPAGHGGKNWEAFKGTGQSMAGKRIRGKGISLKKAEAVEEGSKIWRTDKQKIVTADTQIGDRKVPAKLDLPEGVLFFGFKYTPPAKDDNGDPEQAQKNDGAVKQPTFEGAGQGATLSGRSLGSGSSSSAARIKKKVTKAKGTSSSGGGGAGGASSADAIAIDSD